MFTSPLPSHTPSSLGPGCLFLLKFYSFIYFTLSLSVFLSVCGAHSGAHICVNGCAPEGQNRALDIVLHHSPFFSFWGRGLSLNLGLRFFFAKSEASSILLFLSPPPHTNSSQPAVTPIPGRIGAFFWPPRTLDSMYTNPYPYLNWNENLRQKSMLSVNLCSHYVNQYEGLLENKKKEPLKLELHIWPSYTTSGNIPEVPEVRISSPLLPYSR